MNESSVGDGSVRVDQEKDEIKSLRNVKSLEELKFYLKINETDEVERTLRDFMILR